MSAVNHFSIPDSRRRSGGPPTRSTVRVAMVLTLFLGLLLELWSLRLSARVASPDAHRARLERAFRRQAIRLRETAEQMGGLIVKVGQFLSSRLDLLPQPFVQELQDLQDHVEPASWEAVKPLIERELGPLDTVFRAFDPEPLASASLGQVYRAVARDGTALAVKVQRPHIDRIVRADLAALEMVVALTTRLTRFGKTFDLAALLAEFRHTVFQELDYLHEAANAARIARDTRAFPWLIVPRVYEELTTRSVLAMDIYDGFKITDKAQYAAHRLNPRETAERLIHLYLHMVMETGFFHADPHPGNFLVEPDGHIVLLDYGMTGELTTAMRRQMRLLFVGISERRAAVVVDSLYALGVVRPDANRRRLHQRIGYLLERYYAETLQDVRQLDVESLFRDIETLIQEEPIQFPAHFAFLGRALSMLVGLATALDPDINFIKLFTPYVRRFVTGEAGGTAGYLANRAREWGSSVLALPAVGLRVMRQLEDGELETGIRWAMGEERLGHLERTAGSLVTAVWVLGLGALGVWLTTLHWTASADVAWGLAAVEWLWHWRRRRS
jgi:predicted unusual protein kinase regulating ubiquinone biosynthesis (AarF/ABC1/UbiB family)